MKLPDKNFIIYDGECGFCDKSIQELKEITGDRIAYIARQSLPETFYAINDDGFNRSIKYFEICENATYGNPVHYDHLSIHADAKIYSGAYAVFKALSNNKKYSLFLFLYKYLPLFDVVAEAVYAVIARYRSELSSCTLENKNV